MLHGDDESRDDFCLSGEHFTRVPAARSSIYTAECYRMFAFYLIILSYTASVTAEYYWDLVVS